MKLRIFYDSQCPLCAAEMAKLKRYDTKEFIELVDLASVDFTTRYPHIDIKYANQILHGETEHGELLTGLDVTYLAWALVGKKHFVVPLTWPVVKPVADFLYLKFAKHRYKISYLLTGKKRCDTGQCGLS
ncbi:thiol-disulfide oxidoreductase DCC family protein [Shewanella colwelliana]|uniref:thiol-disulfide oxidoreductase DCC family protein n=1 Tax=Shewanella colwelliana TaxID=23 RepID=UPI003CFDB569